MNLSKQKRPKMKKSRKQNVTASQGSEKMWMEQLADFATCPKTLRFPEPTAFLLDYYSEQLGITPGRFLNELLDDVLPEMDSRSQTAKIKLRIVRRYQHHLAHKLLRPVDMEALFQRIRMASNFPKEKPMGG
jgi:hypothetical protein